MGESVWGQIFPTTTNRTTCPISGNLSSERICRPQSIGSIPCYTAFSISDQKYDASEMTGQERLKYHAFDINGPNPCDRKRIEQVGFDRWLDEVADAPPTCQKHAAEPRKAKRETRRNGVHCGTSFLAKRADARYCSVTLSPLARAFRSPARTRSAIRLRSNSETAPRG